MGVFVFLSTLACAIALGRQNAWRAHLIHWDCELANRPPVPGIVESLSSAGAFDWIYGITIPLLIATLFLVFSKSKKSLLFWGPMFTIHLDGRYSFIEASMSAWGFCGLRDGLELNITFEIASLFFVVNLVVILAVIFEGISSMRKKLAQNKLKKLK